MSKLYFALFVLFALAANAEYTRTNVASTEWSLTYTGRTYDGSHTTFSYKATADDGTGDENIAQLIIGVPNCLEVSVSYTEPLASSIRDSLTGIDGYAWYNQQAGTTKTYEIQVLGNIAAGSVSYAFYGSDRIATGTTQGPSCSTKAVLSCNAGTNYVGVCTGHTARIPLDGSASSNAVSFQWSTSNGYFSSAYSATPTLTVNPPLCNEEFTVTLQVTDADGLTESCSATVSVHDDEAPTLVGLYVSDMTVECDDIPSPVHVTGKDNCDTTVKVNYHEANSGVGRSGSYSLTRTWSSADSCGNTVTDGHVITVIDRTRPTLIGVGADEVVSCDSVPAACEVDATDNCDEDLTVTFKETRQDGFCPNSYTLFRTWSVTDSSGNPSHKQQEIQVADTAAPTLIGLPEEHISVECGEIPEAPVVTAVDDCDHNLEVSFIQTTKPGLSDNDYTIFRTWSTTDGCSNQVDFTQIINVRDHTAPVLIGIPEDVDVDPQHIPGDCAVQVTDNCDETVTYDYSVTKIDGDCPFSYTLVRTWTAIDVSGNEVEETQTVTVSDTVPPEMSGLPQYDLTVECDNIPVYEVTAYDLSDGEVQVDFTETISNQNSDNDYVLTRHWLATDSCGNSADHTQQITVVDSTNPILVNTPPTAITVSCDAVPAAADVTVTDNCDDTCTSPLAVAYTETPTAGTCADSYTLTRTWSASDCSGLTASAKQTITVQDLTAPVLKGLPNDVDASCDDVPAMASVTVSDNCDEPILSAKETRIDGDSPYNYELFRTWSATDVCGNHVTHTQTVSVTDEEPPTLNNVPDDETVDCHAVPAQEFVWTDDNCEKGVEVVETEVYVEGECADNYKLKRTWTATDAAGNVVSATQWVTVQDINDPILWDTPEKHVVAEAGAVPEPADVYASDECDADVTEKIQFSEVRTDGATPQDYILTRTWTVTDNCGNSATFTQTIEVYDTTAPKLGPLPPETVTADCDDIPSAAIVFAIDQDTTVRVIFEERYSDWDCLWTYTITRYWHATDVSGNQASYTQTIYVQDNESPYWLSIPASVSVPCTDPPAWPTDVEVEDWCHEVEDITTHISEEKVETTANDYTLTRAWYAVDTCGNEETEKQTIEVYDRVAPQLVNYPADDTVHCESVPEPPSVTVTDNCDETVVVFYSYERVDGDCPYDYTLLRTWSATDVSGNHASHTQTLTVQDIRNPRLRDTPSVTMYVPCHAVPEPPAVYATDRCSDSDAMTVTYSEVHQPGKSANDYTLIRSWATVDECGNDRDFNSYIYVYDEEKPVLIGTEDDSVDECDAVSPVADVSVTDNCDETISDALVYTETKEWTHDESSPNDYVLTRHWTASDVSGNKVEHTQKITVQDTFKPVFSSYPDVEINEEACNVADAVVLTAHDNCDGSTPVTFTETVHSGDNPQEYQLERVWSTTDSSGNVRTHTQWVTVSDSISPELINLPNSQITYECDDIRPPNVVTATDCDTHVPVDFFEYEMKGHRSCNFGYQTSRVWEAYDDSGNWAGFIQSVTVEDTTAPILKNVPSDVTYECDSVQDAPTVSASDNCDQVMFVSLSEELSYDNPSEYTILRTWSTTDSCGNNDQGQQTVTVQDTTPPNLYTTPEDLTTSHHVLPIKAAVATDDNCAISPRLDYTEHRDNGSCEYEYTLTRTWTATDDAGLTTSHVQIINVEDKIPPVLSQYPGDETVEVSDIPAPITVTATDENPAPNTPVDVVFVQEKIEGSHDNEFTLKRTWTATDVCGNVNTHTQTMEVIDTVAPVLVGLPIDAVHECDDIPDPADVTFAIEHEADEGTTVTYSHTRTDGSCPEEYTITRTWVATDVGGTPTTGIQVITVEDTTWPVFDEPYPASSLEFDTCQVETAPTMTAWDNCVGVDASSEYGATAGEINVNFQEVRTDGVNVNEYTLLRTWDITDSCGHTRDNSQWVVVTDMTDPYWTTSLPQDKTVQCDEIPDMAVMNAEDCTETTVTIVQNVYKEDYNCNNEWTETREWIASDLSGNSIIHTQVLTIIDTHAPTLHNVPDDVVNECDSVDEKAHVTATDNCDENPIVTFTEVRSGGQFDDYTLTRTWTATDDCGNSHSQSQIVRVQDTTNPTVDNAPADTTVECTNKLHVPPVSGSDNCDNEVEVTYYQQRIDGATCDQTYTLIRTWTAHDNEGNTASESQTITVQDTTAPDFDGTEWGMEELDVSCSKIPPYAPWIEAWDNCGDVSMSYETEKINGPTDTTYTLNYIYTATDECGNAQVFVSKLNVHDWTAPMFLDVPLDEVVECSAVPAKGQPEYFDDCTENIQEDYVEHRRDGTCQDQYYLDRTWTITDLDGNHESHTQYLTVQDTTAPTFHGLPNSASVTDECSAVRQAEDVTATDNCDSVEVVYTETRGESSSRINTPNDYTLVRTWTVADDCGNSDDFTQTIQVEDSTAPVFTNFPADATVECDSVPEPFAVEATDNCSDEIEIRLTESDFDYSCTNTWVKTRRWCAYDVSGNTHCETQTIHVQDTTMPQFTTRGEGAIPYDVTKECSDDLAPPMVTGHDNCATDVEVTVTLFESSDRDTSDSSFTDSDYTLTRTWTASDNCGNSNSHTQRITVQDTTFPILNNVPEDVTLECSEPPTTDTVSITENCDLNIQKQYTEEITAGSCDHTYTMTRTWAAADVSGNSVDAQQVIEFQDTLAPFMYGTPKANTAVAECDNVPDATVLYDVGAFDDCDDEPSVTLDVHSTQGSYGGRNPAGVEGPNDYTITNTWSTVDNCGNADNFVQVVSVFDTTKPQLYDCPADVTVEISAIPGEASVTTSDNCDSTIQVHLTQSITEGSCPNFFVLDRTWQACDVSGNCKSCTQLLTVVDTTPPVLWDTPVDQTVECDRVPAAADVYGTDNSGDDQPVEFTETRIDGASPSQYTLTRRWEATDRCGNAHAYTQTVTVEDYTAPILYGYEGAALPADVAVSVENVPLTYEGEVNAWDNCDESVTVVYQELRYDGGCTHQYTLVRIWTGTDAAGNKAEHGQVLEVSDTVAPVLHGVPGDVTVEYPSIPNKAHVEATDNSDGEIELTYEETRVDGDSLYEYQLYREWTATDECGNSVIGTQIISVIDTTPPELSSGDESHNSDMTVECDQVPEPCEVTAVDNGDAVEVQFSQSKSSTSGTEYIITRTWSATDLAGNLATHTQTIEVIDTNAPVLSRQPQDEEVECDCETFPAAVHVTVTDNCDESVTVAFTETRIDGDSPDTYALLRTWSSADSAGNSVSHQQTITVHDTAAPYFNQEPEEAFYSCQDTVANPTIFATDNCDTSVSVQHTETRLDSHCDASYVLTRHWSATDRSGNHVEHTQTIHVQDQGEPEYHAGPLTCIFPPNGQFATFSQASTDLLDVQDECSDFTVTFLACNNTEVAAAPGTFDGDCVYDASSDSLSVRAATTGRLGRTYTLEALIVDDCGNQRHVTKDFWIPTSERESAQAGLSCIAPTSETAIGGSASDIEPSRPTVQEISPEQAL